MALEQDNMFEPEHGAEMRGPWIMLAFGDDLDHLCLRRAEIRVRQSGSELAHDDVRLGEEQRLFVETELIRLDCNKAEGFERFDHRRPIGEVSAVRRAAANEHPRRRAHRGRMLAYIGQNARKSFPALGMRILAAEAGESVRRDRVLEKDRSRPDLSDEALRDLKPGDQSSLPWPQSPGLHWRAHSRAEIDQRNDVVQIVAVIVFVRPGDQQMLAGDARRAL